MRLVKIFGLAALMAVAASLGAASASAETSTQLCTGPHIGLGCLSAAKSVHSVLEAGTVGKLLGVITVLCLGVLVEAEALGLGTPQSVHSTSQSFTGCGTGSAHNNCTVTVEEQPLSNLLKTGLDEGVLTATSGKARLVCSNLGINCVYDFEGVELTAGSSHLTAEEAPITELGGKFFCPNEGLLDGLLEALSATYIASSGGVAKVTKEEKLGTCNPALTEMPRCIAGDPIDAANGNLTEEQTDIAPLGGRGPKLGVTRSYNAQLAATQKEAGTFGWGWTGPYSAYLTVESETATVHQDNGSTAVFYLVEGKYVSPSWSQSTLVKEGENYLFTLPTQEKLEFNKSGQLTKITDRHKLSLTLTYKEGKLETVKDAAGRALTFTYKEGKVESVKDPLGNTVKYTYESGNLATVTLPGEASASWKFKYDASHRLTELTDGRGNTTKNEFDGSSRVTLQTDPLKGERKLEYKETGEIVETTITEPNGSKTFHKFNAAGEPTETIKAQGTELAQTTKYEYDGSYRLIKLTDANSHATTYGYDAEGNKTSEKDPNGNETKWVYNKTHDLTEETKPKGNTTTYVRNAAGDPETIKRPAPGAKTQETKFKWAENGDLEEETDPLSRKTKFEYDTYGNVKAETNAAGDKTTWTYNENGQQITEVSPRGNEEGAKASDFETKTERDAQGRPKVVTDPLGNKLEYKYDAAGNLEVRTNANGHATTFAYDAANRRTEVKAANGDITKTAYDSMGEVKSKTDGNANTTKYERDLLEQVTEEIDPLERKTIRKYDAAGNLKELKDAEGRTTTYTYDAGDRVEKVNYSEEGTPDVTYKYGKDDEVTEMTDGTGTTKKTYDELDRLTEVENGNKEVVKYEYDLGNQITKVTYPNGESITRTFDNAGRLESVKDWLSGETKFAYNRDSALTSTTFPSASENKDEYAYDKADQLEKTTMKRGSETLASISYARDNAGQLKSATQTSLPGAEKPEYEYDENERLKKGAGTEFKYDAANNPTKLGGTSLKYDKASQLEEAGTTKYVFNSMGQRTEAKPNSGPATEYGYNQAGNLISATRKEEGEVKKIEDTYAYDGAGLRASETISGTTTHLAWDETEKLPLLIYDGTNYYIYGPEGIPVEQIKSGTPTYLHHDQQGSTRLLTNSSGEAKGKYTYTPYGAVEEQTGSATTPLGFSGQYRNESTGLIYLRARVYDPTTGQFMSVDPQLTQTGERYGYTGGEPVNRGDPSGLQFGPGMGPRFGPGPRGFPGIRVFPPVTPIRPLLGRPRPWGWVGPPIVIYPIGPPILYFPPPNGLVIVYPIGFPIVIPTLFGPITILPIGPPVHIFTGGLPIPVRPIGPPIGVISTCPPRL